MLAAGNVTACIAEPVLTAEESRLVELVNIERKAAGLCAVTVDEALVNSSRKHSREMAELDYFDHISPTPRLRMPLDRYLAELEVRPAYVLLGENLLYCCITEVESGHSELMRSHTHRANILNPRFERIGVGAYVNESGELWVTETFVTNKR